MTTTPKRRRTQFGLRGLLIGVTLVACFVGWLAWEWRFVRERKAFAASGKAISVAWLHETEMDESARTQIAKRVRIPFWRRLLGDDTAMFVNFRRDSDESEARVLFPEATLVHYAEDGHVLNIWRPQDPKPMTDQSMRQQQ
jgi:hypothetical protein